MAQIPILNGITSSASADFRTSYPRNLVPVPYQTDVSQGYLKLAEGLVNFGLFNASIIGSDRGAINWNGVCYRVMGQFLVSIDANGIVTQLATLPVGGFVRFDYSFDRLAIACSGGLYYWSGVALTQVTDIDLGNVIDMLWIDGYFMTTDGKNLIVTDLADPYAVNPLKYGASESDPDPVVGLLKVRSEVYAMNRYTIEVFQNVGGSLFPFQRIGGAIIQKGAIGTRTSCVFMETVAFLGSAKNEPPSIHLINAGQTIEIATREIQLLLKSYTESQLSAVLMEKRSHDAHEHLYVHLPDQTLVYDGKASQIVGEPVWFFLSSSATSKGLYRARNFVWAYDKWLCGDLIDARLIGVISQDVGAHYGNEIGYQFDTPIIYNGGKGAQIHLLELVALTGRAQNATINSVPQYVRRSYSTDGITFSNPKPKSLGLAGETTKRVKWYSCGTMKNWRMERFEGRTQVPVSFVGLEAELEGLDS